MSRPELELAAELVNWAQTFGGLDNVIGCRFFPEYGGSYCKVEVLLLGDPMSIRAISAEAYHRFILSRDTHTEMMESHSWRNESLGIPPIRLKGAQETTCTFMVESVLLKDLAR